MKKVNFTDQLLKEVINSQYFAVLTSINGDLPYSNLVSFAVNDDFKFLIFITDRNTTKYKNIQQNPNVSLLIDNRTNKPSDISQAVAITVIGVACEEKNFSSSIYDMFLTRHPKLKKFIDNPNNAIIIVKVHEYIIASFDMTKRLVI